MEELKLIFLRAAQAFFAESAAEQIKVQTEQLRGFEALIYAGLKCGDQSFWHGILASGDQTARESIRLLDQMESQSNRDTGPGMTLPAFALLMKEFLSDPRPQLLQDIRRDWLRRLFASPARTGVLEVLTGAAATTQKNRLEFIALSVEELDALELCLAKNGGSLFTNPEEDFTRLVRYEETNPSTWFERMQRGKADEFFLQLLTIAINTCGPLVNTRPNTVLPLLTTVIQGLRKRIDASPEQPDLLQAVQVIAKEYPLIREHLVVAGALNAGEASFNRVDEFLKYITDSQADRAAAVARKADEAAAKKRRDEQNEVKAAEAATAKAKQAVEIEGVKLALQEEILEKTRIEVARNTDKLLFTTQYQKDIAAIMARSDLSPTEQSQAIQVLTEKFRAKMQS